MPAAQIDERKIKDIVHRSIPLTVRTGTLSHETEQYLEELLGLFLKELGREQLHGPLSYCLRELAVNAKKANTKRVYFQLKDLDIQNSAQYELGMKTFKEETLSNIEFYLEKQKAAGLFVKIVFHVKGSVFEISVSNNAMITRKEEIRLHDRIARARGCESIQDALSTIIDPTEGAGLGIAMLVIMLRKIGLDEDAFSIRADDGMTVAKITIPMERIQLEKLDLLQEKIVKEIDELPQFPENIVHIQQLINNPDSEILAIAREIGVDPALTADLLKLVNSAQFMLPKQVDSLTEAVKLVGLRGIRTLLYSYGTEKVLEQMGSSMKGLWEHLHRTAFFACRLARRKSRRQDTFDQIYVGGMLHDMGKIVFQAVHPELLEQISAFCHEKMIPTRMFEDLSAGLNHSEIGARIAEKWNFPQALVAAIRYHHDPHAAPQEFRQIVYPVYLADAMCLILEGSSSYEQLEPDILSEYGIASEAEFTQFLHALEDQFRKDSIRS